MKINKKLISCFLFYIFFSNCAFAQTTTPLENKIYKERNNFGLIFITSKGCHACKMQKEIMNFFEYKYSWLIQEYDVYQDQSKIKLLNKNIKMTPTIFLISKKTKEISLVIEGYSSLDQLEVDVFKAVEKIKTGKKSSLYEWI